MAPLPDYQIEATRTDIMTERELQECVRQLCKVLRLRYYHTWRSIHSPEGFPDCVILGPVHALVVELKSARGRITKKQLEWLEAFQQCGVRALVWRPDDWTSGRIETALKLMASA